MDELPIPPDNRYVSNDTYVLWDPWFKWVQLLFTIIISLLYLYILAQQLTWVKLDVWGDSKQLGFLNAISDAQNYKCAVKPGTSRIGNFKNNKQF